MRCDVQIDLVEHGLSAIAGMDALQGQHRLKRFDRPVAWDLAAAGGRLETHLFGADTANVVNLGDRAQVGNCLPALGDGEGAARLEGTAGRAPPGRRGVTRNPDQLAAAGEMGNRDDQPLGVGVARGLEHLARRPELDDPAGIHHRDPGGERADHGQVVTDIEGSHAMRGGQVADGIEDVRLGGDVEPGGGFVEHDDPRPAGEGDGQPDPLLLSAGKLMRIVVKEAPGVGERHFAHHLRDACPALLAVLAVVVRIQDLAQLGADAQCRVERRGWILRHIADDPTAEPLTLGHVELEDVDVADPDGAAFDLGAAAGVTEQRQPDGRLAGAGLADQPEHFTRSDAEGEVVDDVQP